jgi:hypothetical protein
VSETKYGKTMSASPQSNGAAAFCFLPYKKKPNPTDPNSKPQRSDEVFIAASRIA